MRLGRLARGCELWPANSTFSIVQVEQALDRMLPVFDPPSQLRAYKRELHSLEDLSREFFVIAKRDKDKEGAHLVARLNERICAMRGFSPANIRTDPLTVEVKQQPPRHEKIREVIERLTGRELQQPNDGNTRPLDGDSAVDALSPPKHD
jgi:hypothetical protein